MQAGGPGFESPLLHQTHSWLREGRIGHWLSASIHFGSYLPWRHPGEDYRTGYGARASLGGGPILDAIHEIDYALWLLGRPTKVYCVGGKYSDLEIDVEDVAEILLSYTNTVASIHLDYIERPPRRSCDILGSQGKIHADFYARELRLFDGTTREWDDCKIDCSSDDVYKLEMLHFLDCINGGTTPAVDGVLAMQSLMLAQAARQSMATGLPMPFDPDGQGAVNQ